MYSFKWNTKEYVEEMPKDVLNLKKIKETEKMLGMKKTFYTLILEAKDIKSKLKKIGSKDVS